MPYLSKLVKRIVMAPSAVVWVVAALALSGCSGGGSTAPEPTDAEVAAVVIEPDSLSLGVGRQYRLSARTVSRSGRSEPTESRQMRWTSSDTTVATVDESGLVLTLSSGSALISGTTRGKSGRTKVIVSPDTTTTVATVTVTPGTASLERGQGMNFAATVTSSTGTTLTGRVLTWASSDLAVASVDGTGRVTALAAGTATISATSEGKTGTASLAVTVTPPPIVEPASAPFFSDGFDSGARTNANGFTWSSANSGVSVSSERAYSGSHALRFRFGPDVPGDDSSAEQRFALGRDLSHIWIDYQIYVPANFVHRADAPNNNKFFMIWRDTYGSGSGTWQAGYEYQGTSSLLRPMSSGQFQSYVTSSGLNHPQQNAPFIGGTGPVKLGQWNRIRLEFKSASAGGATDGIMRMWVNDALFAEKTDGAFRDLNDANQNVVLRRGYFLGWANSGFTEITDFFIDDVKFYDRNPGW